jgi:hydroxyacylglutathione hydrolase
MVGATGAKVLAHAQAASRIGGVDRGLNQGDVLRVGRTVELQCLDTPGHTLSHICLLGHADTPALFAGDTLFNAGAGHCRSTGRPDLLYDTFATQLARLPDSTRLFPGHEYLVRNLEFTLDREPDNQEAAQLLNAMRSTTAAAAPVTTLGQEKRINTFFRLSNPRIIARLREQFPELGDSPDAKAVFLKLRELRNTW